MKLDDLRKALQRPDPTPKGPAGVPCECCDKRAVWPIVLGHPRITAFKCEGCRTVTMQLPPLDAPVFTWGHPLRDGEVVSFMDGIELKLQEDGRVHFYTERLCHCGQVMRICEHSGHFWIECPVHPDDNNP